MLFPSFFDTTRPLLPSVNFFVTPWLKSSLFLRLFGTELEVPFCIRSFWPSSFLSFRPCSDIGLGMPGFLKTQFLFWSFLGEDTDYLGYSSHGAKNLVSSTRSPPYICDLLPLSDLVAQFFFSSECKSVVFFCIIFLATHLWMNPSKESLFFWLLKGFLDPFHSMDLSPFLSVCFELVILQLFLLCFWRLVLFQSFCHWASSVSPFLPTRWGSGTFFFSR